MPVIKNITKLKNKNNYQVEIDDKLYTFDEDTILEYRFYKDKEIDDDTLNKAIASFDISSFYNKALSYSYKYGKNSNEVYNYLIEKGLDENNTLLIVEKLKKNKIIDDNKLAEIFVYTQIKNHYGKKMIKEKLKMKKYDDLVITESINNIDYDLYIESLNELFNKIKNKYDKYDAYVKKMKLKQYLYQRGYDKEDIDLIVVNL